MNGPNRRRQSLLSLQVITASSMLVRYLELSKALQSESRIRGGQNHHFSESGPRIQTLC